MRWITGRATLTAAAVVAAAGILAAGSALRPASAAGNITIHPDALVTCSSGGACEVYDNRSTGQAFEGETNKGTGLYGFAGKGGTGVFGSSATGIGVEATTGGNYGAYAFSTAYTGTYSDGDDYGVLGYGLNAAGLYGNGPEGLIAVSTVSTDPAIESFSDGGNIFSGFNSSDVQVFDVDGSGNAAAASIEGCCSHTTGVTGEGATYGVEAAVGGSGTTDFYANGFGSDMYIGNNSSGVDSFIVDNSGNIDITGDIFTGGACSSGCVKRANQPGVHVISYMPHESQPTMEDVGEGQVTNGSGYVHLESTFAKTIDQTTNYMVFITPEGPSRGVYVTQKSASGFAVMENPGGHSTFAFSWRIVAKPYGNASARLPMVNMARDLRVSKTLPTKAMVRGLSRHPLPAPQH